MLFNKVLCVAQVLAFPILVESAGSIVSDFRIRNKDISPSMGRGYSVGTGMIYSQCVDMNSFDLTEPSFDYQYIFRDLDMTVSVTTSDELTTSQGWGNIASSVQKTVLMESESRTRTQKVWAFMSVDKYYISIDENRMLLTDDARNLINTGLYVTFFQVCGPSFIRSARRASEFHGIFSYKSETGSSTETVSYLRRAAQSSVVSQTKGGIDLESKQVTIEMKAYGISMPGGGNAFAARTFEAYGSTMDYAFQTMMDPHSGFVKSIEVVPWANNVRFQAVARMENMLGDSNAFMRRFYVIVNSEHIARMDNILRNRMAVFNIMVSCLGEVNAFPLESDGQFIRDKYSVCDPNTGVCDPALTFTVRSLRLALIGQVEETINSITTTTYSVTRYADEMNSYLDFYMGPCLTDLQRSVDGVVGGEMQRAHWSTQPGCQEISCLFSGTKWNGSTCERSTIVDNLTWVLERYCPAMISIHQPSS